MNVLAVARAETPPPLLWQEITKKIKKREYKIQRIDGLPEKKVTPPKEVYERIKKENKIISNARSVNSNLTFFKNRLNVKHFQKTFNVTTNLSLLHRTFFQKLLRSLDFHTNGKS